MGKMFMSRGMRGEIFGAESEAASLVWFPFVFWELYILFTSFVGESICGHAALFVSHSGATASTKQQI